ncbi:globin domain-containing protein [Mycolicibacillus trivialis]|uniref:globin domain-containing protein n=1 Tax=Mycolicibacillus trivialis TaxID=1798 RepID=UPI000A158B5A|nr:hypothetical protein [Mycolicibacillus trivialis]
MSTLYDRVGGHETLETVVPNFYDRVLADDALSLNPSMEWLPSVCCNNRSAL